MGKEIKLNSPEWTDLIFAGRNKTYGAYFLRNTSSRRHIVALVAVLAFTILVSLLPLLIETVKSTRKNLGGIEDQVTFADIKPMEEQPKEENVIPRDDTPPPPPLKSTIRFTPPVITEDDKVRDEDQMKSQDQLTESKVQISVADVQGVDTPDAVDIATLKENEKVVEKVEQPYTIVEQMPQFPGGQDALMRHLSSNIKYPAIASENGIQGRVMVRFVVAKDGSVGDVTILKGVDPSLDQEAIRVVKTLPKWAPGKQNGVAVPVYYTVPIVFRLN